MHPHSCKSNADVKTYDVPLEPNGKIWEGGGGVTGWGKGVIGPTRPFRPRRYLSMAEGRYEGQQKKKILARYEECGPQPINNTWSRGSWNDIDFGIKEKSQRFTADQCR